MRIHPMRVGMIQTNCYILWEEAEKKALIVDPGADGEKILKWVAGEGLTPEAILLTHGHFDHTGGINLIQKRTGIPLYVHPADVIMLPRSVNRAEVIALGDGETLHLAGLALKVLHTPGHTPGSVCFLSGDTLLAGDTLFAGTIGRTDLHGGDSRAILASIRDKLATLPDTVNVFPGHNDPTNIGRERRTNPFFPRDGRT